MKIYILLLTIVICSTKVLGQTIEIIGVWKSPRDINVRNYTFNDNGTVKTDDYGDLSESHCSGNYRFHNNYIVIKYDTIVLQNKKSVRQNDTLLIINKNTIKVNKHLYVFNQDRKELAFTTDNNGILNYKIKNFGDSLFIQHFRFNKWVSIDTIVETGEFIDLNNYQLNLHSGNNKFRLKTNLSLKWLKQFDILSSKEKIKINRTKITDNIIFSGQTYYELYNKDGYLVKKGLAEKVDCTTLSSGKYILNFDNNTTEIKKI